MKWYSVWICSRTGRQHLRVAARSAAEARDEATKTLGFDRKDHPEIFLDIEPIRRR